MSTFEKRKEKFNTWNKENPIIWELFQKFALEAIDRKVNKLSHWLIINRIRWETFVKTTGHDYKISNDYIAFYARLWKEKYPQYAFLFSTKKMKDEPNN